MPIPVVLVEHRQPLLSPLADLRPQCCIRTGALTLLERLVEHAALTRDIEIVGIACDPQHAELFAEATGLAVNSADWPQECLCLMSHCVLMPEEALQLHTSQGLVQGDMLLAAKTNPWRFVDLLPRGTVIGARDLALTEVLTDSARVLTRPWSVRTHRDAALSHDIALLTRHASHGHHTHDHAGLERADGYAGAQILAGSHPSRVFAHASAKVYPGAILDCEHGAIVLDAHSTVRPGAILIGPCYVGPHSTVLERATIRPGTAIGPWCKVNGEVGGTIFQGFANKSHDGYVGDSWVGEWCNLGAGTTTSNLLNTYGETIAKATPSGRNERTGEVFLGTIFGDHTKTAICTRVMTASVLHTGSMFATTAAVAGTVQSFSWCTDAGQSLFRLEKFLDVMRAAMARRKVTPTSAYVQAVTALAAHRT